LGEKIDDDDEMTKSASQITFEETTERDKSLFSPYDDLAFTMYVDNEVQDIIRKMDLKKQEAVLGKEGACIQLLNIVIFQNAFHKVKKCKISFLPPTSINHENYSIAVR
jgi:hypothetical protein